MAGVPIAVVGPTVDLTYPCDHLGEGPEILDAVAKPSSEWLKTLKNAAKPMVIVGSAVLKRQDRSAVMARIHKLVEKAGVVKTDASSGATSWNGFNVLHDNAGRVAALDIGFLPSARARNSTADPKAVFLLGSDDYDESDVPSDAFVVYQGHHGDKGAARADVVLPGVAYTEKWGVYVNTEGRAQSTKTAVPSIADARDDWKIVRALSEVAGAPLGYDTLDGVRRRLDEVAPHLTRAGSVEGPSLWLGSVTGGGAGKVNGEEVLTSSVSQFYQTDAISRASKTMARCIKARENPVPGL